MTQRIQLTTLAIVIAGMAAAPAFAQSGEAAQVIFTNDKLTVIDAKGVERVVRQGDFVQPGERLITPPGVVGQLRLPDGTLLGARPGTDLKLESLVKSLGKTVLVLNEGNVRVVNVEPPKGPKPMPVDVISPVSTLQITAGDGEAIHVKPGNKQNVEPGTYNRLQQGTAVVRNDRGELPLPPMQPVFAPRLGVPLAPIAFLPINLVKLDPVLTPIQTTPVLISPALSTSLVGDLKVLSPTTNTALTGANLQPIGALPLAPIDTSVKTNLGSAAPVGTTGSVIVSSTLTPVLQAINPITLNTAKLQPPPPQPPPPKVITCKTCLIIK